MNGRHRDAPLALLAAILLACNAQGEATPAGGAPPAAQAVSVAVAPHEAYAATGQTVTFAATVAGATDLGVSWSVQEGAGGGAVTAGGAYTAPATAGVYHVVATSRADPTRRDVASVAVSAPAVGGAPAPLPVISRGVPAYTSGGYMPDSAVNDANYAGDWLSHGTPAWVALDLSGVPAAQRGQVVVVWYNNRTWGYDATVLNGPTYSLPGAYTIDAHAAAGGGAPPAPDDPGWVTLATVTGNELLSRQHLVDLGGRNWVRMSITAPCERNVDATPNVVGLNLDVHDARLGAEDDWFFVGDSITAAAWWTAGQFAQLVNASRPDHFPVAEDAGIGYQTAAATVPRLAPWLAHFAGRYVALSFGTNEANGNLLDTAALDTFSTSYESLVQTVLAAGKIPVIPTIPCSSSAQIQANLPALNARLAALLVKYPQIVPGPDLYATFQNHPEWFADGIHPNATGYDVLRSQWAQAMLARVYGP